MRAVCFDHDFLLLAGFQDQASLSVITSRGVKRSLRLLEAKSGLKARGCSSCRIIRVADAHHSGDHSSSTRVRRLYRLG